MPILAVLGLALKSGASTAFTWLSHRSFWQLACMGLALFALVQHFQIADARHDRDSYRAQRDQARSELNRISSKRNEQKAETAKRIDVVKEQIRHADDQAKVIEQAPLPGQCRTPSEVLQADL